MTPRSPAGTLTAGSAGTRTVRAGAAGTRLALTVAILAGLVSFGARAQDEAAAEPPQGAASDVSNSELDGPLFLQLLVGEIEAQNGSQAAAYDRMLEAARRTGDAGLFQRAIQLAVQIQSGDKALAAAKAWRTADPKSLDAMRAQVQLLVALSRIDELPKPLGELLSRVPVVERSAVIATLPRFLSGVKDKEQVAHITEQVLSRYLDQEGTRTAARTALGRAEFAAHHNEKAYELARQAHTDDPEAPGPVLLALELMPSVPAAETIVVSHLGRGQPSVQVRLMYARALDKLQRIAEAAQQLRQVVQESPGTGSAWLSLGAYELDLQEPAQARNTLLHYVELQQSGQDASGVSGEDRDRADRAAWMLLSQAEQDLDNDQAARQWLERIPDGEADLSVRLREAILMARGGDLDGARRWVREQPVSGEVDERARQLAEVQLLREMRQWQAAWDLLGEMQANAPDDNDLRYEKAMLAERLGRYDEMESLLREVLAAKPDDPQALNALGYSLADRNVRLDEAAKLIGRAVELSPNDPFVLDSLGWVTYRQGHVEEALAMLKRAYAMRPHAEVAAHLAEVLWASGHDAEAREVLSDGTRRDADNEVIAATAEKLKIAR